MVVDVHCIQRLWQKVNGSKAVLERSAVEESICAIDEQRNPVPIICFSEKEIILDNDEMAYVSYRPLLTMRVIRYVLTTNEWGVNAGWRLDLEEV
jgi:hypothetical protein